MRKPRELRAYPPGGAQLGNLKQSADNFVTCVGLLVQACTPLGDLDALHRTALHGRCSECLNKGMTELGLQAAKPPSRQPAIPSEFYTCIRASVRVVYPHL